MPRTISPVVWGRCRPTPDRVSEGASSDRDAGGILTSPGIRRFDYDVVHINAEFADQASDHDPQIVRVDVTARGHEQH
ncbi:hypothetical protein ACF08M_24425 [Streptomyces sp. NPDC015032]|uniref:hypothetical protein n=1 Tax=Streptomyces sp. NPDC015032 TaxID=3364937 RepID=UPI0036FECCEE